MLLLLLFFSIQYYICMQDSTTEKSCQCLRAGLPFFVQSLARGCLVPRPHFSSRPKRFGSRGPCENVSWCGEGLGKRRTGTRQGPNTRIHFLHSVPINFSWHFLREFVQTLNHFIFGDHFIHSHHPYVLSGSVIAGRNWMLIIG